MSYQLLDVSYGLGLNQGKQKSLEDVLKIVPTPEGRANSYADGSTVIINSDRLILNSKKDYVMLCGKEGVTITSPKKIHIDCDDDLYLFSNTEVYIGLPNKGENYDFDKQKQPRTKADATLNSRYEPLVLGLKLANLLQDLIVLLKNAVMVGNTGQVFMSPEMMYNLACLQSRVPEMLSTYAFIDGVSHDGPDPSPPPPDNSAIPGAAVTGGTPGSAVSSNQTTNAGPNQNSLSSAPAVNVQQQAASAAANNAGSTNAAPPIASLSAVTNPVTPSLNVDGPAPTNPVGWSPDQLITSGTEVNTNYTPQRVINWKVLKASSPGLYKYEYNTVDGTLKTDFSNDLESLIQTATDKAKQEANKIPG